MRVLCSTFGSSGDVFPVLGLAIELQRRGHDVTFATNEYYAPLAARHSIRFVPLGSAEDFRKAAAHPDLWNPQRSFAHLYRHLFPVLKTQYELHERHLAEGDYIALSNCLGFGALVAREKLGIKLLSLHLQPVVFQSRTAPPHLGMLRAPRWLRYWAFVLGERLIIDRTACPSLNAWRAELGLPPVKRISRWWHSPDGSICMFPAWYAAAQPDWPQPLVQTDFPLWNDGSSRGLTPQVESFLEAGPPPIVFAPGSMNLHGKQFFQQAVEACQALNQRGILLTEFAEQLPTKLPTSIAHFDYVPLDQLLPRAAMIVHHAGIGTTSQAMRSGVPQIAMPMAHDQFDNSARLIELKIGQAIPATRFNARRLQHAIRTLLETPDLQQHCQTVAQRLQVPTGITRTADAVQQLAAR